MVTSEQLHSYTALKEAFKAGATKLGDRALVDWVCCESTVSTCLLIYAETAVCFAENLSHPSPKAWNGGKHEVASAPLPPTRPRSQPLGNEEPHGSPADVLWG